MNITPAAVPETQQALHPQGGQPACANCSTPVTDLYCGHCGQRVEHHLLSLRDFLGEAAEVLTHADSRLWRTFGPLLSKPGFLTLEFLRGRRAGYLPPFRLYLVLSVVFFLVMSVTTTSGPAAVRDPAAARKTMADTVANLKAEIEGSVDPAERTALRAQLQQLEKIEARLAPRAGGDAAADAGDQSTSCADIFKNAKPAWLAPRLTAACDKTREDSGRELGRSLMHNLGRAMFVFLPVFAAVMKLLYWRPRRYYVEHLLLLLHNHAFVFLVMSALLGVAHFIASDALDVLLTLALLGYVVFYLYKSMRRVYGQGRGLTLVKFAALAASYCIFGTFAIVLTALYSAATL